MNILDKRLAPLPMFIWVTVLLLVWPVFWTWLTLVGNFWEVDRLLLFFNTFLMGLLERGGMYFAVPGWALAFYILVRGIRSGTLRAMLRASFLFLPIVLLVHALVKMLVTR